MDKIGYLKESSLFDGMSSSDIDEISDSIEMANYSKGKIIYQPDDPGEILFILKRGRVRIYRLSSEGKELTLTELGPGTIFGEMSLFGQAMYGSFAEAIEDCVICVIDRVRATKMLKEKPMISLRLAEILGRRLLSAENKLESMALRDVPKRIASLLIELFGTDKGSSKAYRYTHEDLAKMIGTSRESVTLTLSDFKNKGWISISDHHITLTEPESLEDFIN